MRRVGAGITAVVLTAGLAASAALAQDTDGDLHSAAPAPAKGWWDGWFGPAAKPDKKDKPDAKKPDAEAEKVIPDVSPAEIARAARQRERAAYNRRMEVCDRLTEIAVQNNDAAMQTQIDQLRDRAWEVYQRRTAGLPAAGGAGDEGPPEKARASKPLSPARPGGDSVVREVKP